MDFAVELRSSLEVINKLISQKLDVKTVFDFSAFVPTLSRVLFLFYGIVVTRRLFPYFIKLSHFLNVENRFNHHNIKIG